MSADRLCEACQAFLNGSRKVSKDSYRDDEIMFTHHETAESFGSALELECGICVRLWAAFERTDHSWVAKDIGLDPLELRPTSYSLKAETDEHPNICVEFDCEAHSALLVLEPPESIAPPQCGLQLSGCTGSGNSLDFLVEQRDRCLAQHAACRETGFTSQYMPTRLLDVGCTESTEIRLCESKDLTAGQSYVALSHCWGSVRPITLCKSTEATLRNAFAPSTLPQTFQDAIKVTRRLGYRYLWIDSL